MRLGNIVGLANAGLLVLCAGGALAQTSVRSGQVRTPMGSKEIGFVDLSVSGRTRRVVEIVSAMRTLSVGQRADTIATRIRLIARTDPEWWRKLATAREKGEYVVKVQGQPGHLITADAKYAREVGTTPGVLAMRLVDAIKMIYAPGKVQLARRGTVLSEDEKKEAASTLRQAGDDAFAESQKLAKAGKGTDAQTAAETAESKYYEATQKDPTYVVPFIRLAELCLAQGRKDEARDYLAKAKGVAGLDAEFLAEITKLQGMAQ